MFVIIQWVLKIKYTQTQQSNKRLSTCCIDYTHTHTDTHWNPRRETNILPYHVHSHHSTLESRSWAQEMALWAKYTKAEPRWRYVDIRMYIAYTLFLRTLSVPSLCWRHSRRRSTAWLWLSICVCVGERRSLVRVWVRERHETTNKTQIKKEFCSNNRKKK